MGVLYLGQGGMAKRTTISSPLHLNHIQFSYERHIHCRVHKHIIRITCNTSSTCRQWWSSSSPTPEGMSECHTSAHDPRTCAIYKSDWGVLSLDGKWRFPRTPAGTPMFFNQKWMQNGGTKIENDGSQNDECIDPKFGRRMAVPPRGGG